MELKREINDLKSKQETEKLERPSDIVKKLQFHWGVLYTEEFGRAKITKFNIPDNLEVGKTYNVSATVEGKVRNGFMDLAIIDPDGQPPYSWHPDTKSYTSQDNGNLNFDKGEYENTWLFTVGNKKGICKAIMTILENDYNNRVCIDYEIKEVNVL